MQVATVVGIIWAGSLVASGMIANAGLAPTAALYAVDPAQAALTWQGVEIVADGIGNGNGEILGGVWILLVSLAALRSGALPKGLNVLGLFTGAVGIVSLLPGLNDLVALFGLSQMVWYAGVGIVLLRSKPVAVDAGRKTENVVVNPAGVSFAPPIHMENKMKAIVHNRYGSSEVLEYKEIDPPVLRDDDVLLRVHAASVNASDLFIIRGSPWLARLSTGLSRPKDHVLGWDAAGVVEAIGKSVTRFQPGDAVYSACSGSFADWPAPRKASWP